MAGVLGASGRNSKNIAPAMRESWAVPHAQSAVGGAGGAGGGGKCRGGHNGIARHDTKAATTSADRAHRRHVKATPLLRCWGRARTHLGQDNRRPCRLESDRVLRQ